MGGVPVELIFFGRARQDIPGDVTAAEQEIIRLEKLLSVHIENSAVSRLNRSELNRPVQVDPELAEVLAIAEKLYILTDGAFDPTVKPLVSLWKCAAEQGRIPADEQVRKARSRVGFRHISVKGDAVTRKRDVVLDLGGIAKGYIADRVAGLLRRRGVRAGIVNAGGDLRVFGRRKGGFSVGIRDPEQRMKLLDRITIQKGAVVTSGSYERFSVIEGRTFSHIIDPRTGYPVRNSLSSVTVCAEHAAEADGLATGIFVMGFEKGRDLCAGLNSVSGYLVGSDGRIWDERDPVCDVMCATAAVTAVFLLVSYVWYRRYYGGRNGIQGMVSVYK